MNVWQTIRSWFIRDDARISRLERWVGHLQKHVNYLDTAIQVLASQIDLTNEQRAALRDLKTKSDAVKAALDEQK